MDLHSLDPRNGRCVASLSLWGNIAPVTALGADHCEPRTSGSAGTKNFPSNATVGGYGGGGDGEVGRVGRWGRGGGGEENRTGQSTREQKRTEENRTEQNKTGQNRTEQNKTEQNRTEQDRTKQNRTKQNKTHPASGIPFGAVNMPEPDLSCSNGEPRGEGAPALALALSPAPPPPPSFFFSLLPLPSWLNPRINVPTGLIA